jgi:hypothetical protein
VRSHFEDSIRLKSQRLADLRDEAAELERKLSDARLSLERELAQSAAGSQPAPAGFPGEAAAFPEHPGTADAAFHEDAVPEDAPPEDAPPDDAPLGDALPGDAAPDDAAPEDAVPGHPLAGGAVLADSATAGRYPEPEPGYGYGYGYVDYDGELAAADERTEILVHHGRPSAYERGLGRGQKAAIAAAAAAAIIAILVVMLPGGSATWPPSVTTVQSEAARACQNPDVKSEPGQVNFACAKSTRQILWVFALLTSSGDPHFTDPKTGRLGLEPITRAQGGELAWSLNLHHPYNPANPIDSLAVAARAINNIIGGATVTSTGGSPVVQPGLESDSANCLRYTGSPALTSRNGFPSRCALPVTNPAGQGALVADVYQRWIVGTGRSTAQDAAVLFENARNPGDPRVQAILSRLPLRHS